MGHHSGDGEEEIFVDLQSVTTRKRSEDCYVRASLHHEARAFLPGLATRTADATVGADGCLRFEGAAGDVLALPLPAGVGWRLRLEVVAAGATVATAEVSLVSVDATRVHCLHLLPTATVIKTDEKGVSRVHKEWGTVHCLLTRRKQGSVVVPAALTSSEEDIAKVKLRVVPGDLAVRLELAGSARCVEVTAPMTLALRTCCASLDILRVSLVVRGDPCTSRPVASLSVPLAHLIRASGGGPPVVEPWPLLGDDGGSFSVDLGVSVTMMTTPEQEEPPPPPPPKKKKPPPPPPPPPPAPLHEEEGGWLHLTGWAVRWPTMARNAPTQQTFALKFTAGGASSVETRKARAADEAGRGGLAFTTVQWPDNDKHQGGAVVWCPRDGVLRVELVCDDRYVLAAADVPLGHLEEGGLVDVQDTPLLSKQRVNGLVLTKLRLQILPVRSLTLTKHLRDYTSAEHQQSYLVVMVSKARFLQHRKFKGRMEPYVEAAFEGAGTGNAAASLRARGCLATEKGSTDTHPTWGRQELRLAIPPTTQALLRRLDSDTINMGELETTRSFRQKQELPNINVIVRVLAANARESTSVIGQVTIPIDWADLLLNQGAASSWRKIRDVADCPRGEIFVGLRRVEGSRRLDTHFTHLELERSQHQQAPSLLKVASCSCSLVEPREEVVLCGPAVLDGVDLPMEDGVTAGWEVTARAEEHRAGTIEIRLENLQFDNVPASSSDAPRLFWRASVENGDHARTATCHSGGVEQSWLGSVLKLHVDTRRFFYGEVAKPPRLKLSLIDERATVQRNRLLTANLDLLPLLTAKKGGLREVDLVDPVTLAKRGTATVRCSRFQRTGSSGGQPAVAVCEAVAVLKTAFWEIFAHRRHSQETVPTEKLVKALLASNFPQKKQLVALLSRYCKGQVDWASWSDLLGCAATQPDALNRLFFQKKQERHQRTIKSKGNYYKLSYVVEFSELADAMLFQSDDESMRRLEKAASSMSGSRVRGEQSEPRRVRLLIESIPTKEAAAAAVEAIAKAKRNGGDFPLNGERCFGPHIIRSAKVTSSTTKQVVVRKEHKGAWGAFVPEEEDDGQLLRIERDAAKQEARRTRRKLKLERELTAALQTSGSRVVLMRREEAADEEYLAMAKIERREAKRVARLAADERYAAETRAAQLDCEVAALRSGRAADEASRALEDCSAPPAWAVAARQGSERELGQAEAKRHEAATERDEAITTRQRALSTAKCAEAQADREQATAVVAKAAQKRALQTVSGLRTELETRRTEQTERDARLYADALQKDHRLQWNRRAKQLSATRQHEETKAVRPIQKAGRRFLRRRWARAARAHSLRLFHALRCVRRGVRNYRDRKRGRIAVLWIQALWRSRLAREGLRKGARAANLLNAKWLERQLREDWFEQKTLFEARLEKDRKNAAAERAFETTAATSKVRRLERFERKRLALHQARDLVADARAAADSSAVVDRSRRRRVLGAASACRFLEKSARNRLFRRFVHWKKKHCYDPKKDDDDAQRRIEWEIDKVPTMIIDNAIFCAGIVLDIADVAVDQTATAEDAARLAMEGVAEDLLCDVAEDSDLLEWLTSLPTLAPPSSSSSSSDVSSEYYHHPAMMEEEADNTVNIEGAYAALYGEEQEEEEQDMISGVEDDDAVSNNNNNASSSSSSSLQGEESGGGGGGGGGSSSGGSSNRSGGGGGRRSEERLFRLDDDSSSSSSLLREEDEEEEEESRAVVEESTPLPKKPSPSMALAAAFDDGDDFDPLEIVEAPAAPPTTLSTNSLTASLLLDVTELEAAVGRRVKVRQDDDEDVWLSGVVSAFDVEMSEYDGGPGVCVRYDHEEPDEWFEWDDPDLLFDDADASGGYPEAKN